MVAPRLQRPLRRSPTPGTIAVLIFVVLAILRILVFRPESLPGSSGRETVTVSYVIDGDTVDLSDGRRVRLLGIDAPEAGFNGTKPEPWADEATAWLRARIEGKQVRLRIDKDETDRYGRTLAWIFDDRDELINLQIIAEGHARLLADFGLPYDLEPSLRAADSEARLAKRGLWQLPRSSSRKATPSVSRP